MPWPAAMAPPRPAKSRRPEIGSLLAIVETAIALLRITRQEAEPVSVGALAGKAQPGAVITHTGPGKALVRLRLTASLGRPARTAGHRGEQRHGHDCLPGNALACRPLLIYGSGRKVAKVQPNGSVADRRDAWHLRQETVHACLRCLVATAELTSG